MTTENLLSGYLAELRNPKSPKSRDDAFHSLLELDETWLLALIAACEAEIHPDRKAELVQILWRSRNESVIPCLGRMLEDRNDKVWKAALDGLVAFRTPAAVLEIENAIAASQRKENRQKLSWLEEAQVQAAEDGPEGI